MQLTFESHFVNVGAERIHLQRIYSQKGNALFFIHGSIEDGRIFYTAKGKGIAPYLAMNGGFDCYVIDLPGRGKSTPPISKKSDHDLIFAIEEVIPTAINYIRELTATERISVVAHSWGGVLLLASIAVAHLENIPSVVFFGTKRRITISTLKKFLMVDIAWRRYGRTLSRIFGFYPAKVAGLGSENESTASFLQTDEWVRTRDWIYFKNDENIAERLKSKSLPPILSVTGTRDTVLGHPVDVRRLLDETGDISRHQIVVAGKETGFSFDYGHISILTDPSAAKEIYPLALQWLRKHLSATA